MIPGEPTIKGLRIADRARGSRDWSEPLDVPLSYEEDTERRRLAGYTELVSAREWGQGL
jgi:hypothetical protein